MNEQNVEVMLQKLAELIRIGKKPLIGTGRIVDDSECLQLIDQIQQQLPNELLEARVVLQEKDNIIKSAQDTAEDMLSNAEQDANRMLNESDIIQQANREANKIVMAAQNYATQLQSQYFAKIAEVMQNSEGYLKQIVDDLVNAKYDVYKQINNINQAHYNGDNKQEEQRS